eukprot:gene24435-biopygen23900
MLARKFCFRTPVAARARACGKAGQGRGSGSGGGGVTGKGVPCCVLRNAVKRAIITYDSGVVGKSAPRVGANTPHRHLEFTAAAGAPLTATLCTSLCGPRGVSPL